MAAFGQIASMALYEMNKCDQPYYSAFLEIYAIAKNPGAHYKRVREAEHEAKPLGGNEA